MKKKTEHTEDWNGWQNQVLWHQTKQKPILDLWSVQALQDAKLK